MILVFFVVDPFCFFCFVFFFVVFFSSSVSAKRGFGEFSRVDLCIFCVYTLICATMFVSSPRSSRFIADTLGATHPDFESLQSQLADTGKKRKEL